MFEAPAILQLDLEPGQNANAIVAARALIAWVEAVKEAALIVDPLGQVSVGLLSAEPACLRFSTVMRFVEQDVLGRASDALDPYPRIKKLVALNVLVLPGAVAGGLILNALQDDPKAIEAAARVSESPAVDKKVREFYKAVEEDRSITGVQVSEKAGEKPIVSVPRAEFSPRSGLWQPQEPDAPSRPAGGVWDVVVTHPVAIGRPLTWGFMRDGLPFRAKMTDETFLAGIRAGTIPIGIQEGVTMRVRVSFYERLEGQTWVPIAGSWQITEVLYPRPAGPISPMLPGVRRRK